MNFVSLLIMIAVAVLFLTSDDKLGFILMFLMLGGTAFIIVTTLAYCGSM